eukprot:6315504-Prymnesium_polylepis.1
MHRYAAYLVSAPAIYVPLGLVCVLALFGTWFQARACRHRRRACMPTLPARMPSPLPCMRRSGWGRAATALDAGLGGCGPRLTWPGRASVCAVEAAGRAQGGCARGCDQGGGSRDGRVMRARDAIE